MHRAPRRPGGGRSLIAAAILFALVLAGCIGASEHGPVIRITAVPHGPAQAGLPLLVDVAASGDAAALARIGVAWASTTTRGIADDLLIPAAFDGVTWSGNAAFAPTTRTIEIPMVPHSEALFLRGVAETAAGTVWSAEERIAVTPPPAPIEYEVRLASLPAQAYPREILNFAVHFTASDGRPPDAVGVAWGAESRLGRDPATLRTTDYEESLALAGTAGQDGRWRIEGWSTLLNDTVYLRAWAAIGNERAWSTESRIVMHEAPPVDALAARAVHEIEIVPGAIAVPLLAAFEPKEVTVQVGDAVRWINADDATHRAIHTPDEAEGPVFDTRALGSGVRSASFRFLIPGEYAYACQIHPDTMQGIIRVEA